MCFFFIYFNFLTLLIFTSFPNILSQAIKVNNEFYLVTSIVFFCLNAFVCFDNLLVM